MIAPARWVEGYLDIPFRDRGRDRRGCDCFGLVRLVLAERCQIRLSPYGFVSCDDRAAIAAAIDSAAADQVMWRLVDFDDARALDVVVMIDGDERPRHVGIMVTGDHVLHTERECGPSCVSLSHPSVSHRLHRCYRHRMLWS